MNRLVFDRYHLFASIGLHRSGFDSLRPFGARKSPASKTVLCGSVGAAVKALRSAGCPCRAGPHDGLRMSHELQELGDTSASVMIKQNSSVPPYDPSRATIAVSPTKLGVENHTCFPEVFNCREISTSNHIVSLSLLCRQWQSLSLEPRPVLLLCPI